MPQMQVLPEGFAGEVVSCVLREADPAEALRSWWGRDGVQRDRISAVLAFGKASVPMVISAAALLDSAASLPGVVVCLPEFEQAARAKVPSGWQVCPAPHPFPDARTQKATDAVCGLVETVPPDGTLLALVSGGGSAHLAMPIGGLTLRDLREVSRALQRAGADIHELNTVRKHTEQLKGGRLALLCRGHVRAMILSDVPGDDLSVIASGPFTADATTYADAMAVMQRRGVAEECKHVMRVIEAGVRGELPETPKPGDARLARVNATVIAGNRAALGAAQRAVERAGLRVRDVREGVTGEASLLGTRLGEAARSLAPGEAVLWGGEWTVTATGTKGTGGPSQELALAAALKIEGCDGVKVLAFSTDGVDGPTDAAGALVDRVTAARLRAAGRDPAHDLKHHDSHPSLAAAGALLRTGPTGTNVNHIAAAWREA